MADKTYVVEYRLDSNTSGAKKAEKATEELREETEKLGRTFQDVEKDADSLDDRLEALGRHRLDLARRLSENDDRDLQLEFNRTNRRIGMLTKLKNVMDGAAGGAAAGGKAASAAMDLGGSGMRPRNIAIAGVVAAAGAAAVPIGAILGGVISAAVVTVGIAGGIAAASQDPKVRDAAGKFGDSISKEFFGSGQSMVGPIVVSLGILEKSFKSLNLAGTFTRAAPHVTTLAQGVGDLAYKMMPGLNKALDRAGPFMDVMADGLGALGKSLGDFLVYVSESPGAIAGLDTFFRILSGTVRAAGMLIKWLSDRWMDFVELAAVTSGWAEDIPEWLIGPEMHNFFKDTNDSFEGIAAAGHNAAGGTFDFAGALKGLGGEAETTAGKLHTLENALGGILHNSFGLEEAQDDVANAVQRLRDQIKEQVKEGVAGAGALTGNTQAARDNRDAVRDLAGKYAALMVEMEAHGQSSTGLQKELSDILVSMGFSRVEADKYAASLAGVKKNMDAIKSKEVTLTVVEQYKKTGAGGRHASPFETFHKGGTTPAFEPFRVHDGEVMWDDKQHYVSTKAQTEALARAGNGGGGGRAPVNLTVQIGTTTLRRILIDDALARGVSSATVQAAYP